MKASDVAEAHGIVGEVAFFQQSRDAIAATDSIFVEAARCSVQKGEPGFDMIRVGLLNMLDAKIKAKETRLREIGVAFEPGALGTAGITASIPAK